MKTNKRIVGIVIAAAVIAGCGTYRTLNENVVYWSAEAGFQASQRDSIVAQLKSPRMALYYFRGRSDREAHRKVPVLDSYNDFATYYYGGRAGYSVGQIDSLITRVKSWKVTAQGLYHIAKDNR